LVISNTNLQEAIDFFDLKASAWLLILLPYTYLFYYNLQYSPLLIKSKIKPYILSAIILFSTCFIFENTLHGRFIRKGTPQIIKVTLTFITQRSLFQEAMKELPPRQIKANCTLINNSQTFVLILGESCNRNHMSLYGASRKTNPNLENRNDLIVYTNVVSPYSNTLSSLLSMLSNSNSEKI
jgi:heptose-I-phosphate ethanolaminephosphotransferase